MKIFSANSESWLRIERVTSGDYAGFEVETRIDIGHGRFAAHNDDLQWLNLPEFAAQLDSFVQDRNSCPRLTGTYDSFLELQANARTVHLVFAIGDAFCGARTHEYLLTGSFEITEETLLRLARDFEEITAANPS